MFKEQEKIAKVQYKQQAKKDVVRYNLTMRAKDLKGTMSKLERKKSLVIASEMVGSKSQGKELTQSEVVDHRIRLTYQK